MTEREKMLAGMPYFSSDKELTSMRFEARKAIEVLNQISQSQVKQRATIIKSLFGTTGKRIYIESTFRCDYGVNIHVGESFYANFDCVILDCASVQIGDDCMLGPNVGIYTANHPLDATQRKQGIEHAKPVTLGDNVWVGGHSVINPGVSLGDNVVVGSGSVVTKSFDNNVLIAGNPARVIKTI